MCESSKRQVLLKVLLRFGTLPHFVMINFLAYKCVWSMLWNIFWFSMQRLNEVIHTGSNDLNYDLISQSNHCNIWEEGVPFVCYHRNLHDNCTRISFAHSMSAAKSRLCSSNVLKKEIIPKSFVLCYHNNKKELHSRLETRFCFAFFR